MNILWSSPRCDISHGSLCYTKSPDGMRKGRILDLSLGIFLQGYIESWGSAAPEGPGTRTDNQLMVGPSLSTALELIQDFRAVPELGPPISELCMLATIVNGLMELLRTCSSFNSAEI